MARSCCSNKRPASLSFLFILINIFIFLLPFRAGADDTPVADFQLGICMDKNACRPGEAVAINVELTPQIKNTMKVRALNAGSVTFYFGRRGESERMARHAVFSTKEDLNTLIAPVAGQPVSRTFLLTRLTEFSGPMVLQAQYVPGGGAKDAPRIYSNIVEFQVSGAPLFQRDPGGFIVKSEALRIARAALGGFEQGQAIFIQDEAGFNKWYVNAKPSGGILTGLLIDPYRGMVWHKARPFDPKLAADPRLQRPVGMPEEQIPARAAKQ